MSDFDFQPYRDFILLDGDRQQALYTPTDALLPLQVGIIAQQELRDQIQSSPARAVEKLPVLDGLRKYALGEKRKHVILSGRPGSGKSTALQQLRLALAAEGLMPILVQLKGDRSIPEMIQGEFRRAKQRVSLEQIDDWLLADRLVLLLDGVNEIPTDDLRRGLADFREQNATVPMIFTTRDLAVGGDLGIKQRLEMKPLTELQMRKFVGQRLPVDGEKLLGQLGDRLREIAETPLLLKMLCDVFDETKEKEIPENKGELFRLFDQKYEKFKVLPPVSEDFRRSKSEILQHLAFVMMTGDSLKPTEFWLTIDRGMAEREIEEFLIGRVSDPGSKAKEWLEDLLEHYLLQVAADTSQVEFHHQLFQEYYAAERLLGMFHPKHPDVIDEQGFQYSYLNLLKWTEVVLIVLSLTKDRDRTTRIITSAWEVDLLLGSQLIKQVQFDSQKDLIDVLSKKELPDWLKILALGKTRSKEASEVLVKFIRNRRDDLDIATRAASALGKIQDPQIVPFLKKELENLEKWTTPQDSFMIPKDSLVLSQEIVRLEIEIIETLVVISPETIKEFIDRLIEDSNSASEYFAVNDKISKAILYYSKRGRDNIEDKLLLELERNKGINSINEISQLSHFLSDLNSERASSILVKKLKGADNHQLISSIIHSLSGFHDKTASIALAEFISHSDPSIREKAVKVIISGQRMDVIPFLVNVLDNQDFYIRFCSAVALAGLNQEVSIEVLAEGLANENHNIRAQAAKSLGGLDSKETNCWLINALKDPVYFVRRDAALSLAKFNSEEALPELLDALCHYHDLSLANSKVEFYDDNESIKYRILGFNEKALAKLGDNDIVKRWGIEDCSYYYNPENTEVVNALSNFNTEEVRKRLWATLEHGNKFAATALAAFGLTETMPLLIEILDSDNYSSQLDRITRLIAELIDNTPSEQQRDSMILNILTRLDTPESHKNYDLGYRLAIVLTRVDSKYLFHHLPKLFTMLNTKMGKQVLWIIESVQLGYGFYNYDTFCSPPPQTQSTSQTPSKIIVHGDLVVGDKYDNVGNLNTGTVNIAGNQTGETK
jgi:HEAT repeat protein